MGGDLIRARGLTKRFGDLVTVNGIDVQVQRGEAFGFLGPNAAGTSSAMKMVAATSPASADELRLFGHARPTDQGPARGGAAA